MIILQNNKNKIYLTLLLSLLTFVGLIFVWQKFSVSSQAAPSPEVKNDNIEVSSISQDIQNNLELAKLQWSNMQEQLLKTQKQQELFKAAQEYLKNKASSTPTSTASSTVN